MLKAKQAKKITMKNEYKALKKRRERKDKLRAQALKFWDKRVEPAILKAANNGEHIAWVDIPLFSNEGDIYKLAEELGYLANPSVSGNFILFSWKDNYED
jgi:sortase (surface protein transpeptidase)